MNTANSAISVTTAFSLLLHASLAVTVLQAGDVLLATGKGVEIELVSSTYISSQAETEQASRKASSASRQHKPAEQAKKQAVNAPGGNVEAGQKPVTQEPVDAVAADTAAVDNDTGDKAVTRSTNSALHTSSIIELLHTKISEHKQYPYIARRQRREGVARVEFILYPDGSVDNAQLVTSSRTKSLDRAAIMAVESIEPFIYAKEYLHQPEAFQVDVVFDVL